MAPKTRSKPQKSTSTSTPDTETSAPTAVLPASVQNPPKPFILPQGISREARIVTLANPATTSPNRYLYCSEKGFHEFVKVTAPKKEPRSWLFTPIRPQGSPEAEKETLENDIGTKESFTSDEVENTATFSKGYITQNADLMIATPVDPLFLILPTVAPSSRAKSDQKRMFLSIDDHLDKLGETSRHLKYLTRDERARAKLEARLGAVCDTVDAGDEQMYRLSDEKLLQELVLKSKRITAHGLPASLEEKFVRTALQAPVLSIKREESTVTVAEDFTQPEHQSESQESRSQSNEGQDSQTSTDTVLSNETTATEIDSNPKIESPEGVADLLRLRTAFNFILSTYIPPHLHASLHTQLKSQSIINFTPLDTHLTHLATLRSQAQALRSVSDNINRKRGAEDEEAEDLRAEKKRKKEEEDKKKKSESRAMKDLKKVNTSGMKKLSAFFTKVPAKK